MSAPAQVKTRPAAPRSPSTHSPASESGEAAAPNAASPLPRRYLADRNADGTWNIRGVPISAVAADLDDDLGWLTADWLDKAVASAQRRFADDGYLPPLHVNHHLAGEKVDGAGRFLPTGTATFLYEGKPRVFVLADLLNVRQEAFDEILKGSLPYRSIEALDYKARAEIDSLALGDHWVPFFRLPLLDGNAIEVREAPTPTARAFAVRAVPIACLAAAGPRTWVTFTTTAGGTAMPEEIKTEEAEAKAEPSAEKSAARLMVSDEMKTALAMAIGAAIEKVLGGEGNGEESESDGEEDMAPAEQAPKDSVAMRAESKGREAALLSRIAALEAKAKAADDRSRRGACLAAGERIARRYGITRGDLERIYDADGEVGVKHYLRALQDVGTPLDESEDTSAAVFGASEADSPEVAKFHEQGPTALALARQFEAEWKASKTLRGACSLAEYLRTNVPAEMPGR